MDRYRFNRFIACTSLLVMLGVHLPQARGEAFCTAGEVLQQAGTRWTETITAKGRTFSLDVEVITPDVEKAPVSIIAPHDAVSEPQELLQSGGELQANEQGKFVFVLRPDPMEPPARDVGAAETVYPLADLTNEQAYAEDNEWSLGFCKARAQKLLAQVGFGGYTFQFDKPCDILWNQGYGLLTARMRTEDRDTETYSGEPVGEKGYYWLAARQTLHDIPLWRDIRWTFRVFRRETTCDLGNMNIAMDSEEGGFDLCVKAADEVALLADDIPLCPFDKVQDAYRQAIKKGHIRAADQLVFAYMIFRGTSDELVAFPCWILRCRYLADSKQEVPKLAEGMTWQQSNEALMLVVNAQTGELIDPYSKSKKRDAVPSFVSWSEVK